MERQLNKRRIVDVCCGVTLAACACLSDSRPLPPATFYLTMRSKFKDEHPFGKPCIRLSFILLIYRTFAEKRKAEAERIRQKYPDRIPVGVFDVSIAQVYSTAESSNRLFVKKRTGQTSPPSTRRSIWCPLCVISIHEARNQLLTGVSKDLTVGQFVYVIRKRIKLAPEKAIFIFVDEVLPPTAALMSAIYEEHKSVRPYFPPAPSIKFVTRDEDNFLYVSYSGENTFGQAGWIELP